MKTRAKLKEKNNKLAGSNVRSLSGKSGKQIKAKSSKSEIQKLEQHVLKYIVGQNEQVRQIITAIYRARAFQSIKSNVLIIGNSGTGKTATIKTIAKKMDIPCTIEDATKYTQEGYCGADVDNMIYNLLANAEYDFEKAQKGIIVIDEIDKKASHGANNDVSGVEVLKSLLKIIEGTKILIDTFGFTDDLYGGIEEFDTKNIIIIFLGAFPGLSEIREKRIGPKNVGFADNFTREISKRELKYIKQDLIEYGMTEEFVGRIDTIVEMNDLDLYDLVTILKSSKLSIFHKYEKELKKQGVKLYYDNELFESIAEVSLDVDTGARELSNTVNYIFERITYKVLANPGKFSSCTLLRGIVEDNTQYVMA